VEYRAVRISSVLVVSVLVVSVLVVAVIACSSASRKTEPSEPQPKPATPPADGSGGSKLSVDVKHELRRAFSLEILGLEATGTIDARTTKVSFEMTNLLRAAAREYGAIKMGARQRELFDQKLLNGCETEAPECMSKIGTNLGVVQILYGHIAQSGPTFRIRLKLLDVETNTVLEWNGTVQDAEPNMQAAARDAIATLVERFR